MGPTEAPGNSSKANGHAEAVPTPSVRYNGKRLHRIPKPSVPLLDPEASAALRKKLVAEIEGLKSAEMAIAWASRALIAKNTLAIEDADAVEKAFRNRMGLLERAERSDNSASATKDTDVVASDASKGPTALTHTNEPSGGQATSEAAPSTQQVNNSNGKLRRFRDKEHLRFVAKQPCTVCERQPCEPHHIRFAQPRAISRKVSDEFTVPLCRVHHREIHRRGDEAAWWAEFGIDPMPIALRLWQQTRGIVGQAGRSIGEAIDVPSLCASTVSANSDKGTSK